MSGQWLYKSGRTLERRNNTANGGPRFWVTFDDGTRLPTKADAQVNHVIGNPEYDDRVRVWVERGEITDIFQVDA